MRLSRQTNYCKPAEHLKKPHLFLLQIRVMCWHMKAAAGSDAKLTGTDEGSEGIISLHAHLPHFSAFARHGRSTLLRILISVFTALHLPAPPSGEVFQCYGSLP